MKTIKYIAILFLMMYFFFSVQQGLLDPFSWSHMARTFFAIFCCITGYIGLIIHLVVNENPERYEGDY